MTTTKLRKRFLALLLLPATLVAWPLVNKWIESRRPDLLSPFYEAREQNDHERALECVDRLIEAESIEDRQCIWQLWRAEVLVDLGRIEDAHRQLVALFDSIESDAARRYRATLYFRAGELDKASADLRSLGRLFLRDHMLLGACQEPEAAVGSYTKAIDSFHAIPRRYQRDREQELWMAYGARGTAYLRLGEISRAFEDFDSAIAAGDESGLAFCSRAMALSLLDRHDEARADIDRAFEVEGESGFNLHSRARVEIGRGDLTAAKETLQKSVEMFPEFRESADLLGLVKAADGDGLRHITPGGFRKLIDSVKSRVLDAGRSP